MRKRSRLVERRKLPTRWGRRFLVSTLAVFLALFLVAYFLLPASWNGKERLYLASFGTETTVTIFDPTLRTITNLKIPGNTEVSVSQNLGVWPLRSVWELGVHEGEEGTLFSQTLVKTFKFPIDSWAEKEGAGFGEGEIPSLVRAVFSPYKTSLTLKDRLRLGFFASSVKGQGRVTLDLAKMGYLERGELADGTKGFRVKSTIPRGLLTLVADPEVAREGFGVKIIDATDKNESELVSGIVSVLGTRTIAVREEVARDIDCLVSGPSSLTLRKVARVLMCEIERKEGTELELVLGSRFSRRF